MNEKKVAAAERDPYDPNIALDRLATLELCYDLNLLSPAESEAQKALLLKILPNATEPFWVAAPFQCELGYNIEIGRDTMINYGFLAIDYSKISFGNNVYIGPNCIFDTTVPPHQGSDLVYSKPITVGNNVWFGSDVKVLAGVTIGDGAVIGMGSVVSSDIPPLVFAAGCPARVMRTLEKDEKLGR